VVPALKIAAEVGSIKTANVVLLGALARGLSFERQAWEQAISQQVPPKYREMNLLAFARGYELAGN
jgi:indolepyruvate ferredoxin oxidoreductase beta subunit